MYLYRRLQAENTWGVIKTVTRLSLSDEIQGMQSRSGIFFLLFILVKGLSGWNFS